MERINLKLLRALNVLIEHRNITRAAEQLYLSQSAMSRQLAQLREYFNDELLVREGSDYYLTAFAQQLKPRVQSIISQVDDLRSEDAFEPGECQRKFTFSSTDYVANFIFPDVVNSIRMKAPRIDISYRQWHPDWLKNLGSLPIDFVSTMAFEVPENLYGICLGADSPVIMMSSAHPLTTREIMSLDEILDFPFIRVTAGGDKDSFMDRLLENQSLTRRIAYEVPFFTSAFNICSTTEMLLIVPRHIAKNAARVHSLTWKELDIENLPGHQYYLLWHSIHHHDKAHRWVRELIASVMKMSNFSIQSMQ